MTGIVHNLLTHSRKTAQFIIYAPRQIEHMAIFKKSDLKKTKIRKAHKRFTESNSRFCGIKKSACAVI